MRIGSPFPKDWKFDLPSPSGRAVEVAVMIMLLFLGGFWFHIASARYESFAFRTGDTAVAEQAIWNTVHGRFLYQSFLGTESNLSEHVSLIQLLYVPFYAVVPHTLTLFTVIQLCILAGAFFWYRFARRRIGTVGALLSVGIFLFHPLTGSQAVQDMHVVAIAGPAFLMLLASYHEGRNRLFIFWCFVIALMAEFVMPTLFLVGVLAVWDRRGWKWIVPPVIFSVALLYAAKRLITIGAGSTDNIITRLSPESLFSMEKPKKRFGLVLESLAPLLWVFPWFSKYVILLIPSILIALFVIVPGRIGGGSHVFMLIPPVLSIIVLDLFERFPKRKTWISVIALLGIAISVPPWANRMQVDGSDFVDAMTRAESAIKDGGSLTASSQFGAHLNRREEFFLPFNEVMTDYAVLKLSKTREEEEGIDQDSYDGRLVASGEYREVFREGRVVVFVKKSKIAELTGMTIEMIDAIPDVVLQRNWNENDSNSKTVKIGIISDIHSCAGARSDLGEFVSDVDSKATDFNVSLGDNISYGIGLCGTTAPDDLRWVKERLATASPFHFVLGDHDVYDQVPTFDYWLETTGRDEAFYSFDHGGYHVLILDSVLGGEHTREECEQDPTCSEMKAEYERLRDIGRDLSLREGFLRESRMSEEDFLDLKRLRKQVYLDEMTAIKETRSYARRDRGRIAGRQLEWMKRDLAATRKRRIVVFSHIPLFRFESEEKTYDIKNREAVLEVLQQAKQAGKEIVAVSGDAHEWHEEEIDGIQFLVVDNFADTTRNWAVFEWDDAGYRLERIVR